MRINTIETITARLVSQPNGCLVWIGSKWQGYGKVWYQGRFRRVHSLLYEAAFGPVPEGLEVDHLCHTETCPRPGVDCPHRACADLEHLATVTHRVNTLRGMSLTSTCAQKTHCGHGHPFDEANTYVRANGHRSCRTCKREIDKRCREARIIARGIVPGDQP